MTKNSDKKTEIPTAFVEASSLPGNSAIHTVQFYVIYVINLFPARADCRDAKKARLQ